MLRAKILLGVIALWSVFGAPGLTRTCTRRLRTSRTIPIRDHAPDGRDRPAALRPR